MLAFLTVVFVGVSETARFLSPFYRKTDYNGVEKMVLAMHADVLLYPLFYSTPEGDLGSIFKKRRLRDSTSKRKSRKEDEAEENTYKGYTVSAVGKHYLATVLLGLDLSEVRGWKTATWNEYLKGVEVPWRRIYTSYIVPLARLMRAMNSSYTTRSNDDRLLGLAEKYTEGCRSVLGKDFMYGRGIWHRLFHLILQAPGKGLLSQAVNSLSVTF